LKEYVDAYSLIGIKTDTRLFISHHEGKRTAQDCVELFNDVERRRSIGSPIPVFTSDNWDPFEEGLLNVYGFLETPPYRGIGRKPYPVLVPYPSLKYAKVCKKRKNGRLIEVVQCVVYGDPEEVMKLLGADSGGKINTAYIERLNLTIRNSLARFVRKSMNCSKILGRHTNALDFFQAWYNFVKPHRSLRLRIDQGRKKWMKRTPAMAEGLTDHVWTMKELMTFRVPVQ
jgi:IS1 family transposase